MPPAQLGRSIPACCRWQTALPQPCFLSTPQKYGKSITVVPAILPQAAVREKHGCDHPVTKVQRGTVLLCAIPGAAVTKQCCSQRFLQDVVWWGCPMWHTLLPGCPHAVTSPRTKNSPGCPNPVPNPVPNPRPGLCSQHIPFCCCGEKLCKSTRSFGCSGEVSSIPSSAINILLAAVRSKHRAKQTHKQTGTSVVETGSGSHSRG